MAVLLLCSILGYCLFASRFHNRLFDAFAPAAACSFLVILLDIGGILGFLKPTAIALFAAGLLLAPLCLAEAIIKKRASLGSLPFLCAYVVGAAAIYLYIRRNGSTIYHYDNFSHWGLISRFLIRMDKFPAVENLNIISFSSYPVGSACFVYYVCKGLRDGSSAAMLSGQTLLIFSYYFTLMGGVQRLSEDKAFVERFLAPSDGEEPSRLAVLRDRALVLCGAPVPEFLIVGAMVVSFCFYNTELNNLLVDNLLSAGGLAATLIFMNDAKNIDRRAPEVGLVLGALLTIKNSGMFFTLFILIIFKMILADDRERENRLRLDYSAEHGVAFKPAGKKGHLAALLVLVLIPAVLFGLWKMHTSNFPLSKHAMSLSAYLSKFGGSSTGERKGIIDIILPRMLSLTNNQATPLTILVVALALLGYQMKADPAEMFRCATFTVLVYFIYECGTLLMYEFSMSYEEVVAQNGNDYFRYNGTIVSMIGGILVNLAVSLRAVIRFRPSARRGQGGLAILCAAALLCACIMVPGIEPFRGKAQIAREYPDWVLFERISNEQSFSADEKVLVRYSRDYGVPNNGTNYFLLPCTNYVNAFSVPEVEWRLSEDTYDCVIDLVEGTVLRNDVETQYHPEGE